MRDWARYYRAVGGEPRATLLEAVARFDEPGFAVDLGCGTGRDTFELLRRGWHVLAIDATADGIDELRLHSPDGAPLETQVARMEDAVWPPCDLVNASFSLPFCAPARFDALWRRIVESLRPGGRFCGQLFGDRDGWAPADDITFHTRAQAEELLRPFEAERFDEIEEDGTTVVGEAKHWHLFHVVARKR
jgi:tellurite methyltransferase